MSNINMCSCRKNASPLFCFVVSGVVALQAPLSSAECTAYVSNSSCGGSVAVPVGSPPGGR